MGPDYSYSQPSSSDEYDITSLIQAEAELYGDEAESNYHIAEPLQYQPQPECDEGIPRICYCGGDPVVAISSTAKDLGRRYFPCPNVDDGDCHIWKWWENGGTWLLWRRCVSFRHNLGSLRIKEELQRSKSECLKPRECPYNKGAYLRIRIAVRVTHNTSLTMDKNTSYVNLLFTQSQSSVDLDSPEPFWFGSQGPEEPVAEPVIESGVESGGKERRKWSLKEDKILIGAWLNTSKDAVVSNEQKSGQFWKRIVAYYNASPHLVGTKPRELGQCKQRWARINEQVSKFVGCYDAALREQRSGQNDDGVMKAALDYFYNDHSYKFSLEHGWRELRHDQKWCSTYLSNHGGKEKRK
uniref:Myb-like domain-containing protein n=2 Tax=Brassica oleracea var. oleracea TaxID=109376 RepID=A0A0D3BNG0_BRAOL